MSNVSAYGHCLIAVSAAAPDRQVKEQLLCKDKSCLACTLPLKSVMMALFAVSAAAHVAGSCHAAEEV